MDTNSILSTIAAVVSITASIFSMLNLKKSRKIKSEIMMIKSSTNKTNFHGNHAWDNGRDGFHVSHKE
jgi:hypothetical protein